MTVYERNEMMNKEMELPSWGAWWNWEMLSARIGNMYRRFKCFFGLHKPNLRFTSGKIKNGRVTFGCCYNDCGEDSCQKTWSIPLDDLPEDVRNRCWYLSYITQTLNG